jgi:hypothetical protein
MHVLFIDRGTNLVEVVAPYSPELVSLLKTRIPSISRQWNPDTKSWSIAPRCASTLTLSTGLLGFDIEWLTTKGSASSTKQAAGDADLAKLYILQGAPKEVVQAAYRALALLYHPDRAGYESTTRMQEVNRAYDNVKKKFGWT